MIPIGDLPVLLGHARTLLPLLAAGTAARLLGPQVSRARVKAARLRAPALAGVALTRARLALPHSDRRAEGSPCPQTPRCSIFFRRAEGAGSRLRAEGAPTSLRAEGAPGPTGRAAPAVRTGGSAPATVRAAGADAGSGTGTGTGTGTGRPMGGTIRERNRANRAFAKILTAGARR